MNIDISDRCFFDTIKHKAFTLVELLIVIAIIGLLSTVVLVTTKGLRNKADITKILLFDRQIENNLGAYLLGRWSFDEGEGIIAHDTSGWNNHGTLGQSGCVPGEGYCPTWECASEDKKNTASGTGCSLYFNGSNQVNLLSINGVPNTFSAWINISSSFPGGTRIGNIAGNHGRPNNINWEVNTEGRPRIYWNNGEVDWSVAGIDLRTSKWTHYVFIRDSNYDEFYFYLNGVLAGTYAKASSDTTLKQEFRIGSDLRSEEGLAFNGFIDEVKIYEKPLTLVEVQYEYYVGLDRLLAKGLLDQEEYQDRLVLR